MPRTAAGATFLPSPPAAPAGTIPLRVRVAEHFTLDVGCYIDSRSEPGGRTTRTVFPPAVPMVEQVLDYLDAKPDVPERELPQCTHAGRHGVAAAAVCVRWGTYFALLSDHALPLWQYAADPTSRDDVSRVSDQEMSRINVEASHAFAVWTERALAAGRSHDFDRLVAKAIAYLPMPARCAKRPTKSPVYAFANPDLAATHGAAILKAREDAPFRLAATRLRPLRVFANTCVNIAWRNSPIEAVHGGKHRGSPLDRRRVTPSEERVILGQMSRVFAAASLVTTATAWEARSWRELAQLFNLVGMFEVPPSWSTVAASRVMRWDDCSATAPEEQSRGAS